MCVSIPSRIIEISGEVLPMASIEVADRVEQCCLGYVPEAQVGDYVLVQNGFAITVMDPDSAAQSLAAFAELGLVDPEPEPS